MNQPTSIQMLDAAIWQELGGIDSGGDRLGRERHQSIYWASQRGEQVAGFDRRANRRTPG